MENAFSSSNEAPSPCYAMLNIGHRRKWLNCSKFHKSTTVALASLLPRLPPADIGLGLISLIRNLCRRCVCVCLCVCVCNCLCWNKAKKGTFINTWIILNQHLGNSVFHHLVINSPVFACARTSISEEETMPERCQKKEFGKKPDGVAALLMSHILLFWGLMWVGKGYEYGKGPQAGCWLLLLAACKDYSQLTRRLFVCATETGWDEFLLVNGQGGLEFWHQASWVKISQYPLRGLFQWSWLWTRWWLRKRWWLWKRCWLRKGWRLWKRSWLRERWRLRLWRRLFQAIWHIIGECVAVFLTFLDDISAMINCSCMFLFFCFVMLLIWLLRIPCLL